MGSGPTLGTECHKKTISDSALHPILAPDLQAFASFQTAAIHESLCGLGLRWWCIQTGYDCRKEKIGALWIDWFPARSQATPNRSVLTHRTRKYCAIFIKNQFANEKNVFYSVVSASKRIKDYWKCDESRQLASVAFRALRLNRHIGAEHEHCWGFSAETTTLSTSREDVKGERGYSKLNRYSGKLCSSCRAAVFITHSTGCHLAEAWFECQKSAGEATRQSS